jgi:hypothetical protein
VRFEVFTAGAVEVTVRRNVTDTVQFVTNVSLSQRNKLIHKRVTISAEMSITCSYSVWLYKPEISSLTLLLISIIRVHHPVIYVLVCQIHYSGMTFLQPICLHLRVAQLLHASLTLTFFISLS